MRTTTVPATIFAGVILISLVFFRQLRVERRNFAEMIAFAKSIASTNTNTTVFGSKEPILGSGGGTEVESTGRHHTVGTCTGTSDDISSCSKLSLINITSSSELFTVYVMKAGSYDADNAETVDFVRLFLAWIDRPLRIQHANTTAIASPSLLVNVRETVAHVAEQVRAQHLKKVALFHMADELNTMAHPYDEGSSPFAFILRHYFHDNYPGSTRTSPVLGSITCGDVKLPTHPPFGLFYVPQLDLSYWHSSHHSTIPINQRTVQCWWQGSIRNRRQEMVNFFRESDDEDVRCLVEVVPNFKGDPGMRGRYRRMLSGTIFALNPAGNQPENIRWGEIVAAGAINVMVDRCTYCDRLSLFNNGKWPPGIYAKNWTDALLRMKIMLSKPEELARMQQETMLFVEKMNSCILSDMKILLDHMVEA